MDQLTPLARRILKIDADTAYEKLVIEPGQGNPHALTDLTEAAKAGPRSLCATFVTRESEAACILAGLWLWQDYLVESHEICQAIETPSGSLWHAILHRREGDFSNAKYWYARAGNHPALAGIASQSALLLKDRPADKRLLRLTDAATWGTGIVDLCQHAHSLAPSHADHRLAIALQQLEFRTLFEFNVALSQK
jgi:hypothetical protein